MQDQVERVVQFVKYADKVIVTEANSPQKQTSFIQKLLSNLPRQIQSVEIDAYSHSPAALQQQITKQVGASGADNLATLAQRARTVFNHGQRLVIVVNQAQFWLDHPHDQSLADLIKVFSQQANQSMIFVLNGEHGTSEKIAEHGVLSFIGDDLYRLALDEPRAESDIAIDRDNFPAIGTHAAIPSEPPIWKNPTLLMVGGVSLLVIGVGLYSIISRMSTPSSVPQPVLTEETLTNQQPTEFINLTEAASPAEQPQDNEWQAPEKLAALGQPPQDAFAEQGRPDETAASPPAQTLATPPAAEPKEPGEPENTQSPSLSELPDTTNPEPPKPAPTEPESIPAPSVDDARVAVTDNQWFASQPRARAVIQLAAFGSEERARDFIREYAREHGPVGEYRIFTQLVNERLLFTVTYGNYASTQRAEHDINQLPAKLIALDPYARSIGAVRDRIE